MHGMHGIGRTLAAGALALAALTACAAPVTDTDVTRVSPLFTSPVEAITEPTVEAYCPDIRATHLEGVPGPFEQVYICRADDHRQTDGATTYGPWETAYRVVDPADLLAAYRRADAVASTGDSHCWLAVSPRQQDPLVIWVHRGDEVATYYAPVDECGLPSDAARDAYEDAAREMLVAVDVGAPAP